MIMPRSFSDSVTLIVFFGMTYGILSIAVGVILLLEYRKAKRLKDNQPMQEWINRELLKHKYYVLKEGGYAVPDTFEEYEKQKGE